MALNKRSFIAAIPESDGKVMTRIAVTQIRSYLRNPRRQENPEYDRIKASIRAEGLDQPLVITQEPGADDYILQAGGNTRLRILKELYEETGEDRFYWMNCLVKPWNQESGVLFAHLRENELRGSLPFIDKAHAVFEAKHLLEQELAIDELSQRHLETLFKERGFSLSHSMISKMGYAVHTLWPLMPNALAAGLGRPQVEKIRSLERAARHIWARRQLGDDAVFDMIFAQLCQRYDDPEWDIQPLRAALENEMAEEAEQHLQVIRLEMEACLSGKAFVVVDSQPNDIAPTAHQASVESPVDRAMNETTQPQLSGKDSAPEDKDGSPSGQSILDNPRMDTAASEEKMALDKTATEDIASLRDQAWTLAARLAERNGLGELIGVCISDVTGTRHIGDAWIINNS